MKNLPSKIPHLIVLFVCSSILLGAFIIKPPTEKNPYLRLGKLSLPEICTFHNLTGLPCPGCGLTRSLIAAIHGKFKASLYYHRMGILTLFYLGLQIGYRAIILFISNPGRLLLCSGKMINRGLTVLGFLFAINWILTLVNIGLT